MVKVAELVCSPRGMSFLSLSSSSRQSRAILPINLPLAFHRCVGESHPNTRIFSTIKRQNYLISSTTPSIAVLSVSSIWCVCRFTHTVSPTLVTLSLLSQSFRKVMVFLSRILTLACLLILLQLSHSRATNVRNNINRMACLIISWSWFSNPSGLIVSEPWF